VTQVLGCDSSLEAVLRIFREDPKLFAFLEVLLGDGVEVDELLEDWR
jgi:hypothetical protein